MPDYSNRIPSGDGAQGHEMPLGLGMRLMQDEYARTYFDSLSSEEQQKIVSYVQVSSTGEEAKARIKNAINGLKHNTLEFL